MKKLTVAILAIALFAIGSMVVFAQMGDGPTEGKRKHGRMGHLGKRGKHNPMGRMFRHLDLTDEQKAQLKEIREAARENTKSLREQMRANHKQLAELGTDGVFQDGQVQALAAQQAEITRQMIVEKEKIKAQMFAVLTDEQKAKAAEMKATFSERMKKRFEAFKNRSGEKQAN